jgi:GNAT superfamily N-acetyltransferase
MNIVADHRYDNPYRLALVRGLVAYNDSHGPLENWRYVGFYALDDEGALAGGLQGAFEWDWLHVHHLWVCNSRQGLGSRLIATAEAHVRAQGKRGLFLDTMGFQARGFYEKMGFTLVGAIEQAASEHARYFMAKRLA